MKKILIADDNVPLATVLKAKLEEAGYEVFTAFNGNEALQMADEKRLDLIILDIAFPDMDGYEVCAKLKLRKKTNKVPILMCTGKSMIGDVEKGFQLGIAGYIIKPFDLQRVKEKVTGVLNDGEKKE